jgi:hypothetical protein
VLSDVNEGKRCLDRHENVVSDMVSPLYYVTRTLRHLLAGTRNMPSQKGKRAKGVQMTEQQPKTPQRLSIDPNVSSLLLS